MSVEIETLSKPSLKSTVPGSRQYISFPLITPETARLEPMAPGMGIKHHYSIIPISSLLSALFNYSIFIITYELFAKSKNVMFIGEKAWVMDKSMKRNELLVVPEKNFI